MMKNLLSTILILSTSAALAAGADDLARDFQKPPPSARPWVYWFWLNGNITSNGITADLEAMKRVGLGGGLIMEVDQGAPVGPIGFMGPSWRQLFQHVHAEASRLGLEINMNDDAGWNGSGGPWIRPDQSMQEVTWTETNVTGPRRFKGVLPQPKATAKFYRDIAVQAFPVAGDYRIPGIESKAAFQRRGLHKPGRGPLEPTKIIQEAVLTNLSAQMDAAGRLTWDVPPGEWTVLRLGHTSTGVENAPAPRTGRGLECDKLSKEGIEAQFNAMMAKLAADTGVASRPALAGLVATHIDSWENGSQNWTARMREEFRQRRGYDLTLFLPVFTGRVVGSLEVSERFLWDLRRTVSELVIEYYAGHFRQLANAHGMRFTAEAYGSPCDHIPYGGRSDEPMGEFWTPGGAALETCRGMASAGHVYGRRIIGAEAFTAGDQERWREHPALLKALGDRAFCEGINRFVFHRYALQPWLDYRPGMTMGPWGQHYERTQTWWEWSSGWHEYLARCQFLLRQGLFVADLCYLQAEAPMQGFGRHRRDGYDWDECTDEVVLTRMSVQDGRLVLPDGMSYRVLVLPDSRTMTPRLLRKVKELAEAGATVLGPRPLKAPGLSDYPQCDQEVSRLGLELWGDCDGQRVQERRAGRGRIVWGPSPEKLLRQSGVQPDFACAQPWRFIHRRSGDVDIYFVANGQPFQATATCSFRVAGKTPELWQPETGQIEPAGVYDEKDGITRVALTLEPSGSVFVVFRERAGAGEAVAEVRREGKVLLSAAPEPPLNIRVRQARYGVLDDPARTRDVTAKVQRKADAGEFSFRAAAMAEGDDPAPKVEKTLVVDYSIDARTFSVKARDAELIVLGPNAVNARVEKAVYGVPGDPKRTRDVRDKLQRLLDTGESTFAVARMAEGDDPAFGVVKTLDVEYSMDGKRLRLQGTDPDQLSLLTVTPPPGAIAQVGRDMSGNHTLETIEPGAYDLVTASGQARRVNVRSLPPPLEVAGPWQVRFDPKWGGPASVSFEQLEDWAKRPEEGIRYYSGMAVYRKQFAFPESRIASPAARVYLDLGKVAVMAAVTLNGQDLGILWKPPFRLDVTRSIKAGLNELEIRVVNLWINRQIGDEQLPEDSHRNPDGTLQEWPQWVQEGKPSPTGRYTFTSWRLWKKNSPLQESGLIGPVTFQAAERVTVR
jgi:hypothetical protein